VALRGACELRLDLRDEVVDRVVERQRRELDLGVVRVRAEDAALIERPWIDTVPATMLP